MSQIQTQIVKIVLLKIREKRVTWHESVIDNEHMNKRKSKKCCIFHRSRSQYESSSEEDSSDSEDE